MTSPTLLSAGIQIPARITQVLQQMQNIYGKSLVITRVTPSEIELHMLSKTDVEFIANMMTRKNEIFGTDLAISGQGCALGPPDFQILCEQSPMTRESGLFLRYLPNTPNRQDYLAGFWFY